jgi:transcriptional regulator with XRE-family HTH domain
MTATIDSPAAARRRLRLALRKAREASQLTQGEVAESLEWSISKVNRIENGEVTISATDLRALTALLRITDTDEVAELTQDARTARKKGWWDEPRYRNNLSAGTLQLVQFEAEATAIRCFQPTLIPGILQTREYAQAVLDFWHELSPESRAGRLDFRVRRGKQLFGRSAPPDYLVILDESVVMREVGSPAIMAAQFRALLDSLKNPAIIVRIIPLSDGAAIAQLGDFTILDLEGDETGMLYREAELLDAIVDTREVVERHRRVFEQMWELALTSEESMRFLEARAAAMIASLDRVRRRV